MIKSSTITNRLSVTMAELIIDYLFTSDWPALVICQIFFLLLHKNIYLKPTTRKSCWSWHVAYVFMEKYSVRKILFGYPSYWSGIMNKWKHMMNNENICCGYSLEVPHLGTSGEALLMSTHNVCFCGEIRKLSMLLDWKELWIIICFSFLQRRLLAEQRRFKSGLPLSIGVYFVPQQEAWVIERFGKYNRILEPVIHTLCQLYLCMSLTLKALIATDFDFWHFDFFLCVFFRENKAWHFVWIICYTDSSH